jgi:hypothetical protein
MSECPQQAGSAYLFCFHAAKHRRISPQKPRRRADRPSAGIGIKPADEQGKVNSSKMENYIA